MKPIPRGIYELTGRLFGPLGNQRALDNPSIDGIRLRARWGGIETTPGNFDWSNLDGAVNQAIAKNKKCGISVAAGIDSPQWLFSGSEIRRHAVPYVLQDTSGNEGLAIPVPGDTVFINRFRRFVRAFGARYDANPAVSYVIVDGPGNHNEWNVASGPLDTAALGNTQAKVDLWTNEAKTFIDAYAGAFPATTVIADLAIPFSNAMGKQAMIDAVNYGCAKGAHFGLMFSALKAIVTTSYEPVNQIFLHWTTNPTWAQFSYPGGGADGTPISEGLDQALRAAVELKIRGVEIYKRDCDTDATYSYTAPADAMFRGVSIAGTPAGITPRREELLAIP